MKFKQTPRVILKGDIEGAQALVSRAYQESAILDTLMDFQKLHQGTREVNFNTGANISLRKTFGITEIVISSPEVIEEVIVEEIPEMFVFKLYVTDYEGTQIPVDSTMLKYFALFSVESHEEEQPVYLYDPDTMYRRDVNGFIDMTEWGDEADIEPSISNDGLVTILTEMIKDYVPGMAYWACYALHYLPCTYVQQYPELIKEVDKWKEENLLIPGYYEDEVKVGAYVSHLRQDSIHLFYSFFNFLNEDETGHKCLWEFDRPDCFSFAEDNKPWVIDYDNLNDAELQYVNNVLSGHVPAIVDCVPSYCPGTCAGQFGDISLTDVYVRLNTLGTTVLNRATYHVDYTHGPLGPTQGGLYPVWTEIIKDVQETCGCKTSCMDHNIAIVYDKDTLRTFSEALTSSDCDWFNGMYFVTSRSNKIETRILEREIITPLGIVPSLEANELELEINSFVIECVGEEGSTKPRMVDAGSTSTHTKDIISHGAAFLYSGANTLNGKRLYLLGNSRFMSFWDLDSGTPLSSGGEYQYPAVFTLTGVSELITDKYTDVIFDSQIKNLLEAFILVHSDLFDTAFAKAHGVACASNIVGIGADNGL